jgi:hypothetical protein
VWGRIERARRLVRSRLRRRRAQLEAEARLIGAEVRQIGAQLWSRVDDLPLLPASFKFSPIRTQFYGHGAFMGAAPSLLADPLWRRILAFLMPDVFEQVRAASEAGADAPRLIPMMENNPVMAAFGIFRGSPGARQGATESAHHLSGLEWDVFIDGDLLAKWEGCRSDPVAMAAVMTSVLDTTVIAHASSADTLQEAIGICQYRDVRVTPKTSMGGVELDAWVDLFARALLLASAPDLSAAVAAMAEEPRSTSDEACMLHTFAVPWPVRRAVEVHQAVTGKPYLSVIIEIKSLRSNADFLKDFVWALNEHGVHVSAVASFLRDEVKGVSAMGQRINGLELPGPRELQFFHFAGDLQAACDAGQVERGQSVLFNGASVLDAFRPDDKSAPVYSTKLGVVSELGEYRERHDLHIGLYVQEGDCDNTAAALLADLVGARPDTFELGFAWGGLRDEVSVPTANDPRLGYGSQRMLEYVGKARQWRERDGTAVRSTGGS